MAKKLVPMAICYDFDGTLSPGNMQEYDFMKALGIKKPKDFWSRSKKLAVGQEADEISAYMRLMIKEASSRDLPFKKQTFKDYGKTIDLFDGVETWFKRINTYAKEKGVLLKHYIISSGLKEMIEGTKIAKNFEKIYASSFMYDSNGAACWPAVVLNYTSKTQYLFRINKGCEDTSDNKKVNAKVDPKDRPMPFKNMVYIGDGDTDIPCMRIVKREGGHSVAVYKPNKKGGAEKVKHLIEDGRVNIVAAADYSHGKTIDKFVKTIIDKLVIDSKITGLSK